MNDTPAFETSDSTGKLAEALAAVQESLRPVAKDKTAKVPTKSGGSYTFTYADLASVLEQALTLTSKQGIAVTQALTGNVEVVTQLTHTSGEWMRARFCIEPTPDKYGNTTPQSIGSAATYARRYALCGILGIATEDDDGQAAARPEAGALETNKPALVRGFWGVGIKPKQLERYLGHSLLAVTDDEELDLIELGKSIRDGGAGEVEAREQICGPDPIKAMAEELA